MVKIAAAGVATAWVGCGRHRQGPTRRDVHTVRAPAEPVFAPGEGAGSASAEPVEAMPRRPDTGHRQTLLSTLDAAGGFDFVSPGDTVLLKVNTNSGDPYPYSTSPDVIRWLAELLKARKAKLVVGDRSFWGDGDTRGNFVDNGIAAAAREVGARLVAFEPDGVDWVELPPARLPHWKPPIRIPRLVREVHHVVNLPCVKTHFITGVTLSMKNLLGVVHPRDRARDGNLRSHHPDHIHHQIAEVHGAVRPTLNVLDGYRALVSGGPTPGSGAAPTIANLGFMHVSMDRLATDEAGIRLLAQHASEGESVRQHTEATHPTLIAARALAG